MNSLLARKFRFRRNIIIAENGSKVLDDFTIRVYNLLSLSRISSIQTAILYKKKGKHRSFEEGNITANNNILVSNLEEIIDRPGFAK